MRTIVFYFACVICAAVSCAEPAPNPAGFEARVHKDPDGATLPYRLLIPKDYVAGQSRPLVVWLHGSGEKGTDNLKQLKYIPGSFLGGTRDPNFPAFVLVPQCPPTGRWMAVGYNQPVLEATQLTRMLVATISELKAEFNLDDRRISVGGFSMGGYAVWELLGRYPDLFAAAFPVAGVPTGRPAMAAWVKDTPIWIFHGEKDASVPVAESRKIAAELKSIGGKITYTEYAGGTHECTHALAEVELPQWLLGQKRKDPASFIAAKLPDGVAMVVKTLPDGTHGTWTAKAARRGNDVRLKIDNVNYQVKLAENAGATLPDLLASIGKGDTKPNYEVTGTIKIDASPWIIVEKLAVKE